MPCLPNSPLNTLCVRLWPKFFCVALGLSALRLVFGVSVVSPKGDVAVCPGESARYGDHKCNHDQTHRVCAQLLDGNSKQPLSWGQGGDFWAITGQKAFQWDNQIRANNGDSWCICMWATARLIEQVGCDNVHLHCSATDVQYVLNSYNDGGYQLHSAHECLKQKCQVQDSAEAGPAGEAVRDIEA